MPEKLKFQIKMRRNERTKGNKNTALRTLCMTLCTTSEEILFKLQNLCSNCVKWNIAKIWIVFNIFSSIPEVSKKNSKACFCISVAGILPGTAKKYHKKYRKKFNFLTIPQVSKSSICRDYIPTMFHWYTVSELMALLGNWSSLV